MFGIPYKEHKEPAEKLAQKIIDLISEGTEFNIARLAMGIVLSTLDKKAIIPRINKEDIVISNTHVREKVVKQSEKAKTISS